MASNRAHQVDALNLNAMRYMRQSANKSMLASFADSTVFSGFSHLHKTLVGIPPVVETDLLQPDDGDHRQVLNKHALFPVHP